MTVCHDFINEKNWTQYGKHLEAGLCERCEIWNDHQSQTLTAVEEHMPSYFRGNKKFLEVVDCCD